MRMVTLHESLYFSVFKWTRNQCFPKKEGKIDVEESNQEAEYLSSKPSVGTPQPHTETVDISS